MTSQEIPLSSRNLLTSPESVSDDSAGGCCGDGGCQCGSGSAEGTVVPAAVEWLDSVGSEPSGVSNGSLAPTVTTEFLVTGMTCGHCVSSVTEEVGAVAGVDSLEVVLKKGGSSRVTVSSAGPIDADAVRTAVEEAGYQLA